MRIVPQIGTFFDWILQNEAIELPYPRILEGDTLFDGEVEFTVDHIGDCPYVVCPSVWSDYGTAGQWAYVHSKALGQATWVPLTRLYQLLEAQ